MASLHGLLGLGLAEPLELLPPDDHPDVAPVPALQDLLVRAYGARIELVLAARQVDASAARLDAAAAGWQPDLDISGTLAVDDTSLLQGAVHWFVGAGLVEDLTEGLRTPERVRVASESLRATLASARRVALAVEADVQSARLDALQADAHLDVATRQLGLAETTLSRMRAEIDLGTATPSQLLDAEQALTQARARRSAARDARALSRLALRHATGELLPEPAEPETARTATPGGEAEAPLSVTGDDPETGSDA
jgi:outer membrane protein TolC